MVHLSKPYTDRGRKKKICLLSLALSQVFFALGLSFSFPPVEAQELAQLKQIKLTDKLVQGYITAQKDLEPLSNQDTGEEEDLMETLQPKMEEIAVKNGFEDLKELQIVGSNISYILYGIDRKTGAYTEAVDKMKMELEALKADTSIPEEDKKYAIEALNNDISNAQPLQFKENIEVVRKYLAELDALTFDGAGESLPEYDKNRDALEEDNE
ncbi:MAG: hypothetical protein ACKOW3_02780 [Hyphomicrobium sp.]